MERGGAILPRTKATEDKPSAPNALPVFPGYKGGEPLRIPTTTTEVELRAARRDGADAQSPTQSMVPLVLDGFDDPPAQEPERVSSSAKTIRETPITSTNNAAIDDQTLRPDSPMQQPVGQPSIPSAESGQVLLFLNLIDGEEMQGSSSELFSNLNPAKPAQPLGRFPVSTPADARHAVEAARQASAAWGAAPLTRRAEVLNRLSHQVRTQRRQLIQMIARETGKMPAEASQEVDRAAELLQHQAAMAWISPSSGRDGRSEPGFLVNVRREALGVVVVVPPWQYPLLGAFSRLAPAILWGNTVILRTHELAPHTGAVIGLMAMQSGAPRGVVNVIHGLDRRGLFELTAEPAVAALAVGGPHRMVVEAASVSARHGKRLQLEETARAVQIVLPGASLAEAARAAAASAFSLAGQDLRCLGRTIVHASLAAEFRRRLNEAVYELLAGPGEDATALVPPMISQGALEQAEEAVRRAVEGGASVAAKGRIAPSADKAGYYMAPVVLEGIPEDSMILHDDFQGPVLAFFEAQDTTQAIALANNTLAPVCFIHGGTMAEAWAVAGELRAESVAVNQPAAAMGVLSHGWSREHLNGQGMSGLRDREFYTETRVITFAVR